MTRRRRGSESPREGSADSAADRAETVRAGRPLAELRHTAGNAAVCDGRAGTSEGTTGCPTGQ